MPDANITKTALASSMKRLMKEKPFSKISVIDICDGCGMNRKSFYYHFKDKYDLVNWIFYIDFIGLVNTREYRSGWDASDFCGGSLLPGSGVLPGGSEDRRAEFLSGYFHESMAPIVSFFLRDVV